MGFVHATRLFAGRTENLRKIPVWGKFREPDKKG
jgi:hypothetical protein